MPDESTNTCSWLNCLPIWRYLHGRAHTICAVIVLRQPGFQRFDARLPSDVPVLPAEFSIGQPVEQYTIITQLITTRLQIKSSQFNGLVLSRLHIAINEANDCIRCSDPRFAQQPCCRSVLNLNSPTAQLMELPSHH